MIRKVKYKDIDFAKYSACIENSAQRNFYAQKEILDQLSGNWELLVLNDYEAVMPVPLKKKYGFTFVASPVFCQQLGVFSPEDNSSLNEIFRKYLVEKFNVFTYPFNWTNHFEQPSAQLKNYVIPKKPYEKTKSKYSKGRKAVLKKAKESLVVKKLILDHDTEAFIISNFKGLDQQSEINEFITFFHFLSKNNQSGIYGAFLNDQLINLAMLEESSDSMILLGLINDERFLTENGASLLIDFLLENWVSKKNFDFMGGNVRGIEIFFKSFGAERQYFNIIRNSKANLLKKILKL